jgi:FkbM family methyltransferase
MNFQLTFTRLGKALQVVRSSEFLRALLRHGVLAGTDHRNVLLNDFATVVDVGANRGQFSLAVRRWCPNARIIAFEPLPGPASKFRTLFRGDKSVSLHETAIGRESGQQAMHVSGRDDSSSLLPISHVQVQKFPGTEEVSTIVVRVSPLDAFVTAAEILSPAMLKLDVQGFELEALRGCDALLRRFTQIYCECSFIELYRGQALAADVVEWLAAKGFRLTGVFNLAYDEQGQTLQGDLLFNQNSARQGAID